MKKALLFLLLLLNFSSDASEPEQLRDLSVKFFTNNLDSLIKRSSGVLKIFSESHNKNIFYHETAEETNFGRYHFYSDKYWRKVDSFSSKTQTRNKFKIIKTENVRPKQNDINILVYTPILKDGYYFVEIRFWLFGKYSQLYEGNILCQYTLDDALVKYLYSESIQ